MRFVRGGINWEGRKWSLHPAVSSLCDLIETEWPEPHGADGTVASKPHDEVNPRSDHRPWPYDSTGLVSAVDVGEVTEDDGQILAEALRTSRDPRIKYVIHEERMFSSYPTTSRAAWEWGAYSGPNPHGSHVHVSVLMAAGGGEWNLNLGEPMTQTISRLEVATAWYQKAGVWMDGTSTEDPQARLTRLAESYRTGERTLEDIVRFVGRVRNPEPGEMLPAWVLDPSSPASAPVVDGGLTVAEADLRYVVRGRQYRIG